MTVSKKFVLLSTARSGTSLLMSTLRTHPAIYSHGEIFHPKVDRHIRPEFRSHTNPELRDRDPVSFVYSLLEFTPGAPCVGFKMWRGQQPAVCDVLLADENVAKIILERENRLAAFSSGLLARQSGVWNASADDKNVAAHVRKTRISFDGHRFGEYLQRQKEILGSYRSAAKGPVLDISFLELVGGDGFRRVQEFLEVDPLPLTKQKQQLHSADILERFYEEDHELVRETLSSLGCLDWLKEGSANNRCRENSAAGTD